MTSPGYHRFYLRIDLTSQSQTACPIPDEVLRTFIGGTGLATWVLLQETSDTYDALAPEAPLIFCFSPLVGSPLTTQPNSRSWRSRH